MDAVIYQQDTVAPHCSCASLEYFYRYLPGGRLITGCTDHPWHAHSLESRL